ncbi:MAG TPA: Ig-like domain-containing protein, partial [Noviherbaspirillum sp.]
MNKRPSMNGIRRNSPSKRRSRLLALEPRVLFDGVALHDASPIEADAGSHDLAALSAPRAADPPAREILFIDSAVPDADTLAAGARDGILVVRLDAQLDSFEQIADVLERNPGASTLHLVSHGGPGFLSLGGETITESDLNERAGTIAQWRAALADNADVLLYGCDVSASATGQRFISRLSELSGADVAASSGPTGAAALGANWTLESTIGTIESAGFLATEAAETYVARLATQALNGNAGWVPIMMGTNFDPQGDSQAKAADTDIVGDTTHAAVFTAYDDGGTESTTADDTMAFRIRIDNPTSSTNFGGVAIIGMDADLNGSIDIFFAVDGRNNGQSIRILDPGTGANVSPNTTSTAPLPTGWIASNGIYSFSGSNYSVNAVSAGTDPHWTGDSDLGNDGKTDVFVSFKISFQDIAAVLAKPSPADRSGTYGPRGTTGIQNFTKDTVVQYVAMTQTQLGPINGDIGGVGPSYDKNASFSSLGTYSAQMSPSNPISVADAANITDPVDANGLINASEDDTFVVRGTASANGWVRLIISDTDGGTGDITVWTQADGTGAWSAPAQNLSGLADGTLTFSASLVTGNGSNTLVTGSSGDTATATHDTVGPTIGIEVLGTSGKPIISGTSADVPAGSTITIKIDPNGDGNLADLITYTAVVSAGGTWSVNTATVTPTAGTMPATGLTAYAKVTAEAQDAAGNTGTATAITKPTVTPVTTNDTTPTITGTWGGTNGGTDTLAVAVNGITYTTADGALSINGMSWSLTLPNGNGLTTAGSPYEVTATVTRSGTSASDTTSSELTLVSGPAITITGGATATSNDATPLIEGTTTLPQGSIITVRIDPNGDGNLADAVTYVATVGAGGAWSIDTGTASPISGTFPYSGIDGLAKIHATATDTSGTSATADQNLTVTVPSVNIGTITGANNGAGLLADNILNNAEDDSVTVSGTSSNVSGQTVTVTVSDGTTTKSGTATVQSDGTWTATFSGASALSGLKDGSLTVTAAVSTATDTTYVSHDATPPTIRVNSPATLSNNSQVIEGVSDLANGKSVLVSILTSAGTTVQHTVTVTDGKWVTPTLSLPSGSTQITVSSTDTDTAGNTAVGETVTRTVSSNNGFKQPTLSIGTIAGDNVIVTGEIVSGLTLSGTYNTESQSDKSGTITITITGKSLSTGNNTTLTKTYSFSNASSGNWSVSLTKSEVEGFANGTLNVTAAMTVSGNNASTYSLPLLALTNGVGQTVAVDTPIGDGNLSAAEDGPGMTISGTATNANAQTINLTVSDTDGTTPNVTGTATVAANGTWSVTGLDLSSLANGTLTVTASLGSVSGTATVLHDKTPPLITITHGPDNSDASPLLQGTSDLAVGSTLTVSIDSDANGSTDATYTTTVQSDGSWSVNTETATPASGSFPADGLNATSKVTVSGSDAAGNNTSLMATTITAINSDTGISSSDFVTSDRTLVFTGKAEPNSTVAVSLNGSSIGTVTADGTGAWTLDHSGTTLAAGSHTLTAVATKSSSVTATATQAFTIDTTAPAVAISAITNDTSGASTSDFITNDNTLVYSGTAEADSTVVVTLSDAGNATVFTRTVTASGGNWSVDRSAYSLADGTYTLTAVATDKAGNSSTAAAKEVVVDTTATIGLTTNYKSRDTTPLITGTTDIEAGRTITVEIDPNNDGNNADAQTYTTTVQSGGTWSVEATTALSGTVGVRASGTDAAGNSATASRSMVIDTSSPAVTVTEPIGDGDLSASEDDAVVIQGSTSSVPAGSILQVSITDGTTTINDTATVAGDGAWQLSALNLSGMANGTLTVTATFVDDAGIPYADTATVLHNKAGSVTIDSITNDTGTLSDFITSDQTLVLSGSASAGATVTLTLTGPSGGFTNQNVTANSSGVWSYDYTGTTLSNGTYTLQAVSGATVTQSIVVDNAAPSGPVTVSSQTTADTTPTITGTATVGAGESLFVTVNGVTYSTGDGNLSLSGTDWTLTLPASQALTPASTSGGFNGKYHVVATIRDTAGNTLVDSTTYELTIQDTAAPAIDLDPSAAGAGDGTGIHHGVTSAGGATVSVDDNTDAATLTEASDKITSLAIAVGGLQDGANELLVFGSTTIAANGSSGTQSDVTVGGVRVNITYASNTFTIQKYNYGSLTASEARSILRDVQYRNTAATVTVGNRTFGFTATDDAGNTSSAATATVNVTSAADTTAPAAPTVDLTAGSDSGTSDSDDKTSDTTPTIRISLNGSGATAPVSGDV